MRRALPVVLGIAASCVALAGCFGGHAGRGDLDIDEHEYDTAACPTGDDVTRCSGVFDFGVAANPARHEYLVLWRANYRPQPDGMSLYARRVDARSGEAIGRPVRVARFATEAPTFLATFDAAARQYVVATQEGQSGRAGPVTLRRLTTTLKPAGPARHLGSWLITDLVGQPAGPITLVGLEGPPALGRPADDGRRALRIETLAGAGRSGRIVHVRARPREDLSLAPRGAYDTARERVLVVWDPTARYGVVHLQVAQVRAAPAGDAPPRVPPATARSGGGSGGGVELTCNPRRRDCLVAYAAPRDAESSPTEARLVSGTALGPAVELGRRTAGPVGATPTGNRYGVTWAGAAFTGPTTMTIFDGTTTGASASVLRRYRVAGPAKVAADPASSSRLLVWRAPAEHNSTRLVGRLLP